MSVYPPKKGGKTPYWQYDFTYRGVRFRGSTGEKTRRKAESVERQKRQEVAESAKRAATQQDNLNVIFARYWEEYGQYLATADVCFYQMENLKRIITDKRLPDIEDDDISKFVAKRRGEKARNKDGALVSNATVNREVELLRRIFGKANKVWKIKTPDAPNWGEHLLHEPDERVRELTAKEQKDLFKHLREDFHAVALFSIISGVRMSNAIRLTWKMVDLESGLIVMKVKSKVHPDGKNHAIPITADMREILLNERGNNPIFVFTYVCQKHRFSKKDKVNRKKGERYPFSKSGLSKPWRQALAAAGIDDYRWHDNRHTSATRLIRKTGNLKIAQKLLGHTDIATTTKYAHVNTDDIKEAMELVAKDKMSESTSEKKIVDIEKRRKSDG